MLKRALPVLALALVAWVSPRLEAAEVHEGIVVSADVATSKLVMTDKDGKNEHTHTIDGGAVVTLDGKTATLAEFKKGFDVKITTDLNKRVTRVEGTTKPAK
jgi:hypothetical protein